MKKVKKWPVACVSASSRLMRRTSRSRTAAPSDASWARKTVLSETKRIGMAKLMNDVQSSSQSGEGTSGTAV